MLFVFSTLPPVMRVFPRVAAYHRGPLRETPPSPLPTATSLGTGSIFPSAIQRLAVVSGHHASPPPPPPPLTAQRLGNRLCLMCWQFHLTLISRISLASSSSRWPVIACSLSTFPPSSSLPRLPLLLSSDGRCHCRGGGRASR